MKSIAQSGEALSRSRTSVSQDEIRTEQSHMTFPGKCRYWTYVMIAFVGELVNPRFGRSHKS